MSWCSGKSLSTALSLRNSSGKCCPLPLSMEAVPGTAACRWKQLSLLLSSLSSLEVLAELWGYKREHWLGRSGIQGPETRCSVSFLLILLRLGIMDSDLESAWWFLSWEGQSWEYIEKPVLSRAVVHLLVTAYRELFCFFLITPSTGTSAGNLRRKRFHGHTGQPMLCDSSLSELGVLTGGCQEASTVTVHGVPVLQRLIFQSRLKRWTLSCILSQTKRVHLYKALVISQIKN